jgi:protein-S-isoprenylcysteine O-methyltransferase Ste14
LLRTFDFVFRGAVLLGVLTLLLSNFRQIRRNRIENENRETIKYYRTSFQWLSIYASYFTSILTGLAIFRIGSLLKILSNGEIQFGIFNIVLLQNEEVLNIQSAIIFIGVVGSILYIFFSIVMNISYLKLGKNFSINIDIKEGNKLVKNDIYGIIRHPIYLSEIILPLAASFALQSWTLLLWGLLVVLPIYIIRAKKEDELLQHYYGDDFTEYKLRVGGFFPYFKK